MIRFAWAVCAILLVSPGWAFAATPSLVITNLPAYGSTDPLAGLALNVNPSACAVAAYIYVPGYGWVTKPTCAQPLAAIQPDGTWSANITTGGADSNATRIAAFLVPTNFSQPCVLGASALPENIYSNALASFVITRQNPAANWITFSGYAWWLKTSAGPVGPGPNYFSDSTNNVWVDTQGWLHLRITNRSNEWQCAEIVSARSFGYGSYRFELGFPVDTLDPNVTLGLFTWSDDPAYSDREIDVECGRWSNPSDVNNAQFVVQPYNLSNHLLRYRVPTGVTNSTQLFTWQSNRVDFQSQTGSYTPNPPFTNLLKSWSFTDATAVPLRGDENIRLNLWLVSGVPPASSNEVEVIIKSFDFVPLGPPPPGNITAINLSTPGQSSCNLGLAEQPDWRYTVESSVDLVNWTNLTTLLATNLSQTFADTNAARSDVKRFYRTITVP